VPSVNVVHGFVISHRNINVASHNKSCHIRPAPGQTGRGEPIAQTNEDGENPVTTETNTAFEGFKDAFKNIQNLEVPEAAREFVKKTANTAKDRAAEAFAGSERVTAAVENAVTESVTEAGKISRNIQQAIYEDAEAFFSGIDKLASAKSISEAVEIQSSLLRSRGEVFVSRAKATADYLGKLAANGAKSAQDNFAKVYTKTA
jgi:phasin